MTSIPHRGRIPFVGRRKELERLAQHRARLEGSHERGRHLIVVEGFSGVGKTTFVEEFLATLDREGRSFTPRGAYSTHLRRPPLAPLLDALDELLAERFAQQRLLSLFTDITYAPLLARLPMLSSNIGMDSQMAAPGPISTGALAALIASVLSHAARFRPVVLLLDDIHCIPDEDLQALLALNTTLRNAPVLILATMRRDVPEADRMHNEMGPMLQDHFYLPPLTLAEVAELLTELYGARLSAQLTTDITRYSEGVPIRIVELIRRLHDKDLLQPDARGGWQLSPNYKPGVLSEERTSVEKVLRLDDDARRVLLLLGCAGGQASRDELAQWFAAMASDEGSPGDMDIPVVIERLQANVLVKPIFASPDQVAFVHDSILAAQRQIRTEKELRNVARMLLSRSELRRSVYRWSHDIELFRIVLEMLPPVGTEERSEIIESLVGRVRVYEDAWNDEHRARVYQTMRERRDTLTTREYARVLGQMASWAQFFTRLDEAIVLGEELYDITKSDPTCADLHAESCLSLAASRFYKDRSTDVSELMQEAWDALSRIQNLEERLWTELNIVRLRATQVPVSRPQEAIDPLRRALNLAEQLRRDDEKYTVLPELVVRSARMRDEENLRYFCDELLKAIRNSSGGGGTPPPFTVISSAVRATLIYGDIFLARTLFESWSRCSAPLEITDFVAYSYLTALFAYADGAPSIAADTALNAREEMMRHQATSKQISWELEFNYTVLQMQIVPYLIVAGRFAEALGMADVFIEDSNRAPLPDVLPMLRLYKKWLRWRCMLPVDAPINLCWPSMLHSADGGANRQGVAYDAALAHRDALEFRQLYAETIDAVAPPPRFIAETLLAALECAERNYEGALAALDRAAKACEQVYDWQKELEHRASRVTVKLRWAASGAERATDLVEEAMEEARTLLGKMSEKGLTARINQLSTLWRDEAGTITGISHRDLPAQFDRMGSGAHAAAHAVLRNSRSQESGPIDRARLFLMGPLRLMRPHSYMELGESAFGREAARTLLTGLVAAEVLNRALTREELASQIAPKARTQEQQKKALYNAASAARSACGSPNSILAVGASGLELNISPELEGSVWVDALEVLRAVQKGMELDKLGEVGKAFDAYQNALLLARKGDFASDIYADWVDAARDRLREVVRHAALSVARIALRSGLYAAGIEAVSIQLTRDPFDEESHRALIRLYSESGNRSAALKQFDKCRKLIKREFGVEPEPETLRLRQEILEVRELDEPIVVRR